MNELENLHPAGARLDAVATGDADAEARAHVASCAECAAYVERLRAQINAFAGAQRREPDRFVEGVVRSRRARAPRRRGGAWLAVASSGLALAAGVLLLLQAPRSGPVAPVVSAPAQGPIRFKGGAQVAVVVERSGAQSRQTGALHLAPGDRIRLEIALEHDAEVEAGVLTDAGEWGELQRPARLTAGTHFSDQSIAFDAHVDEGWILVGPPEAVDRARRTKDFAQVHAIRIHATPP